VRPSSRGGAAIVALGIVLAGSVGYAQVATAQTRPATQAAVRLQPVLAAQPEALSDGAVATSAKQAVPGVEDCGLGKNEVRPKSLILTCADANDLGKDLVWSKWGPTAAYATGVDTWNACVPYCAASKTWYSAKATFTLSKPAHTAKGWLFERLTVHITGHTPQKMEKVVTFSEAPVHAA
jgi:hypothetical protein